MFPSSYCVRNSGRSAASMLDRPLDELGLVARQRKDRDLHGSDEGMESQDRTLRLLPVGIDAAFPLVSVDDEGQGGAVHPGGALDQQRRVMRLGRFVEETEVFAGERHVRVEVVGSAVRDRLELSPAPRKEILDVDAGLGIMRALRIGQLVKTQPLGSDAVARIPVLAALYPRTKGLHVGAVVGNEIFQLRLFELANPKGEVSGRDLVAERFSDLRHAERRPLARALVDVFEVHEDALRGLRAQVRHRRRVFHRPDRRAHHQIEVARLGKRVFAAAVGALRAILEMVGAKAMLTDLAVDHHVVKGIDVPRCLPYERMHDDGRIEGNDVVAQLDGVAPPGALDVLLEHGPQRPVIPEPVDSAVDLAGLKDETAALGEGGDLFHRDATSRGCSFHWVARFIAPVANPRRSGGRATRRLARRTCSKATSQRWPA